MNDLEMHGLVGKPLKILDSQKTTLVVESGQSILKGDLINITNQGVKKYSPYKLSIDSFVQATSVNSGATRYIHLTDSKGVALYRQDSNQSLKVRVVDFSSGHYVLGTEFTIVAAASDAFQMFPLNETQFMIAWQDNTGAGSYVSAYSVAGTTITHVNTVTAIGNGRPTAACKLSNSRIAIMYNAGSGFIFVQVATLSGSTISMTSAFEVASSFADFGASDVVRLDETTFLAIWGSNQFPFNNPARVVVFSNNTLSSPQTAVVVNAKASKTMYMKGFAVSPTKAVMCYAGSNHSEAVVLSIDASTKVITPATPLVLASHQYAYIHGASHTRDGVEEGVVLLDDPTVAVAKFLTISGTTLSIKTSIPYAPMQTYNYGLQYFRKGVLTVGIHMSASNKQGGALMKMVKPDGIALSPGTAGQTIKVMEFN